MRQFVACLLLLLCLAHANAESKLSGELIISFELKGLVTGDSYEISIVDELNDSMAYRFLSFFITDGKHLDKVMGVKNNRKYSFSKLKYLDEYSIQYEGKNISLSRKNIDLDNAKIQINNIDDVIFIKIFDLDIPISAYKITVKDRHRKIVLDEAIKVAIGSKNTIEIKPTGLFEKVLKNIGFDNIILLLVISFFTIIGAALKDRIGRIIEKLLDFIGSHSRGKLNERRFRKKYIENIVFNHKYLKVIGFNSSGMSKPLLEEVFISLRVSTVERPERNGLQHASSSNSLPFKSVIKNNRNVVILGNPGAGKTTCLSYLLLIFARSLNREVLDVQGSILPIFIPLRRLSLGNSPIVADIADPNCQIISPNLLSEVPVGYFERRLKEGKCIVLLDGLDEVTNQPHYHDICNKINNLIVDYPNNRYIVTCRIAGWRSLLNGFSVFETQDLDKTEINRFIFGWHRAVITQSEYLRLQQNIQDSKIFENEWKDYKVTDVDPAIDQYSRKLLHAIDSNTRILAIATNPMLLSLICLVHLNRRFLPRGRTILYSQCIELLIDFWDRSKGLLEDNSIPAEKKELVLRELAYNLHSRGKSEDTAESLEAIIETIAVRIGLAVSPRVLLEDIERRSGLLSERSMGIYGFSHLTLQEYLVAKHIQLNHQLKATLLLNLDKQEWREVTLLYSGLLDDSTELVSQIMKDDNYETMLLAAHCIGDAQKCDPEVANPIVGNLFDRLDQTVDPNSTLIIALASVACDYSDIARSSGELLAERLISLVSSSDNLDLVSLGITILKRSRIGKGLPAVVSCLRSDDMACRIEAESTAIFFGNASIPFLQNFFSYSFFLDSEVMAYGSYSTKNDANKLVKYLLDRRAVDTDKVKRNSEGISQLMRILVGINTYESAKFVCSLYLLGDEYVSELVSINLCLLFNNEDVVRQFQLDDELGFFLLQMSSKSISVRWPGLLGDRIVFNRIYGKLLTDISILFSNRFDLNDTKLVDNDNIPPFIIFPAMAACIHSEGMLSNFERMGFEYSHVKEWPSLIGKFCRRNVSNIYSDLYKAVNDDNADLDFSEETIYMKISSLLYLILAMFNFFNVLVIVIYIYSTTLSEIAVNSNLFGSSNMYFGFAYILSYLINVFYILKVSSANSDSLPSIGAWINPVVESLEIIYYASGTRFLTISYILAYVLTSCFFGVSYFVLDYGGVPPVIWGVFWVVFGMVCLLYFELISRRVNIAKKIFSYNRHFKEYLVQKENF